MVPVQIAQLHALIILALLAGSVFGEEAKLLKISTLDFPPYAINDGLKPRGIYYDTANRLAREAGFQSNNTITPYARIKSELKSGQTDMTIMFKYQDLEDHVIYVAPLKNLKIVVIALNGTTFKSTESLKGKKIAYLRGANFSRVIDDDPDILKHKTADFLQGVKMLMAGRVDAIIGPMAPIISAAANVNRGENLFGDPLLLTERTPWVQISKKSAERISAEQLRSIYDDLDRRGVLNTIRNRYLNPDQGEEI
jgi:polar amino acid transport system substrate-binding protein